MSEDAHDSNNIPSTANDPTDVPVPPYDSLGDTLGHIRMVQHLMTQVIKRLMDRAFDHDKSKLFPPEKPVFDILTPRLKGLTYGSEEYRAALRDMKPALDHHYSKNSHHPEHDSRGIHGMSLLDLIEMLCDWKAATTRHNDGCLDCSLEINRKRFEISPQLQAVIENTAFRLGWLNPQRHGQHAAKHAAGND